MAEPPGTPSDQVSDETRLMVARARERAGTVLTSADVFTLAAEALGQPPADMTAPQIRQLAAAALMQAERVSYLLGKLAGLMEDDQQAGGPGGE